MRIKMNNKAFNLVELIMAVSFSVLLMAGVYGFYNAASQSYSSGISGQNLQDGADIVLGKIIEGETESGAVYRLSTAVSYMIPNGSTNYCILVEARLKLPLVMLIILPVNCIIVRTVPCTGH